MNIFLQVQLLLIENWISAFIKIFSELCDHLDKEEVWNIFIFVNHTGEKTRN